MAVNLKKGQRISLEKSAGRGLSMVTMGLGWDASGGKSIDLDASCVMFDADKNMVDAVYFKQLTSKDGSVEHTGDNRTGEGEGDDEQIIVDLTGVPGNVSALMFVVNNYTGQGFEEIENAFCRLVDVANGVEVARFDLSCQGGHTAQVMAKVYRHNGEWKMHAIGENASGKTFRELMPVMTAHL